MSDEAMQRTNIYLSEEDRRMIAVIGRANGLKTTSSVVRYALRQVARRVETDERRRQRTPQEVRANE